ncbi:MAG: TnsA endonuclease N-terminal domain-containing protein [Microcystaceae cyanobacterium]
MSRYTWSPAKYERFRKEGRGEGTGKNYKPWLTIQDVPSDGQSSRIKGWKTNRIHHLMSRNEKKLFNFYEWIDEVVDIREQFPLLDSNLSLKIAEELGIKHHKKNNLVYVPTTDLRVTLKQGNQMVEVGLNMKPSDQLDKERTMEKFRIERLYYQVKGIQWYLITEEELPFILTSNIDNLRGNYRLIGYGNLDEKTLLSLLPLLKSRLQKKNCRIADITSALDEEMGFKKAVFNRLFQYLIGHKQIIFDIENIMLNQLIFTNQILEIRD